MGQYADLPEKAGLLRFSALAAQADPIAALNRRLIDYDSSPDHRVMVLVVDAALPALPPPGGGWTDMDGAPLAAGALYRPDKIVIAAIGDDCLDETLISIAQVSDLRFAAAHVRFGCPALRQRSLGVAARSRLFRQIPHCIAARLCFTPETIDASEALRVGLVSQMTSADALADVVVSYAQRVALLPPFAARGEKETLRRGEDLGFDIANHYAVTTDMLSHMSPDGYEGIASFVEKRAPVFWDFTKD